MTEMIKTTIRSMRLLGLFIIILILAACKKDNDPDGPDRLFRPAIKGSLKADANYVKASWEKIIEAESYTMEISRDTFKTIEYSITVDTTTATVSDILWNQLYQVQVRANAAEPDRNSKMSDFGEIKTAKFPTILKTQNSTNIKTTSLIIEWNNTGDPATELKVLLGADSSLVSTIPISAEDISNGKKLIEDLQPQTKYIIYIYSGSTLRGWDDFMTKAPLSGTIIDLTDITNNPAILEETLVTAEGGSTIILKKGITYTISSAISLNKAISIMAEDSFDTGKPTIQLASNFNLTANSVVDFIRFKEVILKGTTTGYVFNINQAGSIGEITFENCDISTFRGIVRTQNAAMTIDRVSLTGCFVDNIGGYGVVINDGASSRISNILLSASTFFKAEVIIGGAKNNANSVKITECTFYMSPSGTKYLADYNGRSVTEGILISNNILSLPFTPGLIYGARIGSGSYSGVSNYYTTDFTSATNNNKIPGLITYPKDSNSLFEDPVNGNFKIKDTEFAGKNSAGDPRWR